MSVCLCSLIAREARVRRSVKAWLREVFPDIYADVDSSDPAELRKLDRVMFSCLPLAPRNSAACQDFAPSEKRPNSKKHRHKRPASSCACSTNLADRRVESSSFSEHHNSRLKDITIPNFADAFAELKRQHLRPSFYGHMT